jgi:hypothetical protein
MCLHNAAAVGLVDVGVTGVRIDTQHLERIVHG